MMVLICAAGKGTRLSGITGLKLLYPVAGKPLILRVLDAVAQPGVNKIVLVVGYAQDKIKKAVGPSYKGIPITYVTNPLWETKGNMSSLYAARDAIDEDLLFTTGDILISEKNVRRILDARQDACILMDSSAKAKASADVLKLVVKGGRIARISKAIPPQEASGAACGFYKLALPIAKKFYAIMQAHFDAKQIDLPWNIPVEELCAVQEVVPIESDGSFCMDIDTPEDLIIAEQALLRNPFKGPV